MQGRNFYDTYKDTVKGRNLKTIKMFFKQKIEKSLCQDYINI